MKEMESSINISAPLQHKEITTFSELRSEIYRGNYFVFYLFIFFFIRFIYFLFIYFILFYFFLFFYFILFYFFIFFCY